MNSEEKQKIWRKCIEDILIFCLTNSIDYRYNSKDDTIIKPKNIKELINVYVYRFEEVFNTHENMLLDNNMDVYEWVDIIEEFTNCIGITSSMHQDNRDAIDERIRVCISDIRKLCKDSYSEDIELGKCCYCSDVCNRFSPCCMSCTSGIYGIELGVSVPENWS